ncbi:hypothetical protein DH2020_001521 [Rehmannia glutinosa]|uniref:Uncharacterized protein n=1 Tax=Rehmannia glutinosa TaxID=99300 RepID=A0ABR0XZM0_REHGL
METLVAHHRNHHYSRNRGYSSTKFGSFGSPPSGNFQGINCRAFQSGEGLLPTPSKDSSTTTPVSEKTFSASFSPRTPSPSLNESQNISKRIAKSSTISIPVKFMFENNERELHFSERWAGPAYSNSPPPSSLPIPKFQLRPKRTVSLDLPTVTSEINLPRMAKSAPASPTRERSPSPCHSFDISDSCTETNIFPCDTVDISDSATKTLRRILNLDNTDE